MPTALAGMFRKVLVVLATALAAMAAVPRVLVRLATDSLPIWNIPFSMPAGMPTRRMRRISPPSGRRADSPVMRSIQPGFWSRKRTAQQATARETRLASAAPMTPILKPKMRMALPPMLTTFITRLDIMLILLLPCARKRAAPALYRPMKG